MTYGEQLRRLKLVQAITKAEGRDNLSQSDVIQLHAMVLSVADQVGDLLAAIPMTFRQYTKHDLLHAWNLINLMGRFIPSQSLKRLNAVELTILVLTALLHDFGMYVEEEEKAHILDSDEFQKLLEAMPERKQAIEDAEAAGMQHTAAAIRDAVLADYFRKLHPERARTNIRKHLTGVLRFRDHDLTEDVATICESHGWGVFDPTDPRHPQWTIEKLKASEPIYGVPFNPQYTAACLRLADIMDFDRSRTPLALLKTITDPKSQSEWMKHLSIRGWTVTDREVVFHARCAHPEHYVAIMEFLDWVDAELRDCRRLLRTSPVPYALTLPSSVDRFEVEMADPNYLAGAFRFELDYERIMKLLMDRSLYPDPGLFLRELLQNSLDACRVRSAMAASEDAPYIPRITVWNSGTTIVFQDNGIGMSRSMIEKYFMRVGHSYYRSVEFEIERKRLVTAGVELEATSQFGIGFLSCFMVADRIEIDTWNDRSTPLRVVIEGATKYFTIEKVPPPDRPHFRAQGTTAEEDRPPMYPGTRITLHLRPETKVDVRAVLALFAVNVEVPVTIVDSQGEAVIPTLRWERTDPTVSPRPSGSVADIQDLSTLLMPWYVPLDQYDFCHGLVGQLWFWMLRDANGNPAPRVGHLEISDSLSVVDPIRTYSMVMEELDEELYGLSPRGLPPSEDHPSLVTHFNELWEMASDDEREGVLEWFKTCGDRPPSWFSLPGCSEALASGDESWAFVAATYHQTLTLGSTEQLALHGIVLPAGITAWEPMTGRGHQLNLFRRTGGGYRLDARRSAPIPAANRLFVDPVQGRQFAVPVSRAIIRFVLEAREKNKNDKHWSRWSDDVFDRLCGSDMQPYLAEAVRLEQDLVHQFMRLRVTIDGRRYDWSIEEARQHFGRWARFGYVEALHYDSNNRILLLGHPQRWENEWLVDLDMVDHNAMNFE